MSDSDDEGIVYDSKGGCVRINMSIPVPPGFTGPFLLLNLMDAISQASERAFSRSLEVETEFGCEYVCNGENREDRH